MQNKNRFFSYFQIKIVKIQQNFIFFKNNITLTLTLIFSSFFFGNVFALLLEGLRQYFRWDPLILLFFLIFLEIINFFVYSKNIYLLQFVKIKKFFNSLKIGLLLGLFIDAFKVGS